MADKKKLKTSDRKKVEKPRTKDKPKLNKGGHDRSGTRHCP